MLCQAPGIGISRENVFIGGSVNMLNRINGFAIIGSLGLIFAGLVACSGEKTTDESRENDPADLPAKIESTAVVDSNGDTTGYSYDTIPQYVDSTKQIDPVTGDTFVKYDTVHVPADTTIHWGGNSALVITEISPVNLDWLDQDGGDPGWIEIYNAGDVSANLKEYSLVENLEKPRKWVFGEEIIPAHGFRVVFCDKGDVAAVSGHDAGDLHERTHTNWKLNKNGGSVYLIDRYYAIRDSVNYPALSSGMSWGIMDAGVWKYFEKPTPEERNDKNKSDGYDGVVPKFSFNGSQGGFYSGEVKLNPPTVSDGLKVRCTQDGSVPTENSPEFNSSITISENTVLRCAAYKKGLLTKDVVTNTYFIDEMVNMPVVAVSVDPQFFEKHYVKKSDCGSANPKSCPAGLMEEVEYPVHVEYFAEGSKSKEKAFEIDAGISLMGGWSRVNDKKSVAIAMHEEYQAGRINYPLFETRKGVNDKYKAFNLRNNGNRFVSDYIEDAMAGALLEGSGVDYQRSRQVVVFYNGKYYGIHDMRERYNRAYVETNYGIDDNTVKLVKHLGGDTAITSSGDDPSAVADYLEMLKFIGNNDMSKAENYQAAKDLIDIGNYADYMIAEIYYHNGDWPNNNVRAWSAPGQPWKFMVYDVDHGFDWKWGVNNGEFSQSTNMFDWIKKGGGNDPCKVVGCFANLYTSFMKNEDFKRLFLNHTAVMWQSYLNSKNVAKVVDKMTATIDPADMQRDIEKYKDDRSDYGSFDEDGSHLKEWAEARDTKILSEYQEEFGVGDMVTVKIASSGKGIVLMEGMNLPGSTATSTSYSGKFFNGLQMELTAVPSAGAVFKGWSDDASITEKTRLVTIKDGLSITAKFE